MQISVIIPTLNAETHLQSALHALTDGAVDGIVREVIIVDGGSSDATFQIADSFGATLISSKPGRGIQMKTGARYARSDWLLFLHADTMLGRGWIDEIRRFIVADPMRAGVFTLKFDEKGIAPLLVAVGAMVRSRLLALPYGDQGLLISRQLYDQVGGFQDMSLMEDVDFIRRLKVHQGRKALHILNSSAITSARRYRQEGYIRRVLRNFICMVMFKSGVSTNRIKNFYEGQRSAG